MDSQSQWIRGAQLADASSKALATASGLSGLPERQSVEKMTSNFDK